MNIILFDSPSTKKNLLPFTYTRPIADIRIGILTITEKWKHWLAGDYSYLTEGYLQKKFPQHKTDKNLYINGNCLPNQDLVDQLKELGNNEFLLQNQVPIAFMGDFDDLEEINFEHLNNNFSATEVGSEVTLINHICDIFVKNREALIDDFQMITRNRKSALIEDPHTAVYNGKDVFIEEGAQIHSAILNAESGPIYIGKNVEIGEGSIIRGASAVCEASVLNLGTRIRGDSTIGPFSKVGGEISNSVVFGYSSKVLILHSK